MAFFSLSFNWHLKYWLLFAHRMLYQIKVHCEQNTHTYRPQAQTQTNTNGLWVKFCWRGIFRSVYPRNKLHNSILIAPHTHTQHMSDDRAVIMEIWWFGLNFICFEFFFHSSMLRLKILNQYQLLSNSKWVCRAHTAKKMSIIQWMVKCFSLSLTSM